MDDFDFIKQPDYLCLTGSRLYGTARYGADGSILSDEDLRGFVLPPIQYLLGLKKFEEEELEGDHKVWSLKNYLTMLLKGNTQALEILFAPPAYQRIVNPLAKKVISMRSMFLGTHYYKSISGFAYSEWRKVRGVKLVVPERSNPEDFAIQTYLNTFPHHPKDLKDAIIEMMMSLHEKKEVPSTTEIGSKRRTEIDKFGFSPTGAHHAIRMLYQCIELMKTGFITFPRPEAVYLSQVKRGEIPFEDIEKLYIDLNAEAEASCKVSSLPPRPDSQAVWEFYEKLAIGRVKDAVMNFEI
jgi:predicted nucleotidyltransferase